ncbi:MAG: hypothetical protein BEU01_01485 [Marine Group III euryarchaeote CG-Epi4]|uniref:DUF2085 domain-containing protein n=1 Tax=Marine Group III euryarchaeote CG-Epi4 TaxID=1888998 RepID=A0A1J5TKC3_9ARCH|nr:MAG: hypothetical protein BEU01_01485 [Marine Group III euryarchaeote CG-Epi4]|tara:strand:+ start:375 stop:902 length:528 start_codon:yes stop_codon:yes gene_type:complete
MTSWKIIENWNHMGKWNKVSFVLLWGWLSLLLFSPYMIDNGTTGDLSGVVGKYDNKDVINDMNLVAKSIYYIGDLNCHQLSHRSYAYNDNQMSFCARDTGIFVGLVLGFTYASRKKMILTLPLVIAALIPIGLDGTIQLLTDYESTNPKRLVTGLMAGIATGIAIKIIADSLDEK